MFGRSVGYIYAKNGATQQTVTTGYAPDGRIASAGFMHGGVLRNFTYGYLPGSNLMEKLVMPNDMTFTQSYEAQRDLLTGMEYKRGDVLVTQRSYTYDALGRPLTRDTQYPGKGITHNDSFVHNSRSELVHAQLDDTMYGYDYDNIGNRRMAVEGNESSIYETNELNQYTRVVDGADTFELTFDLAGNQTLVKTTTGVWHVAYNAENRPIFFTSEDGSTIVECTYDYMGRRATKKVTTNGTVTLHQRYIYRGYLQIACCDLTRAASPCLWHILWDPTQPVATRPLAIRKDGVWYAYGWDLTKNLCEIYGQTGYIRTLYTYTPYGAVTAEGDVDQPIQWSSEYNEAELGLVYYNYRYYNPIGARWISRDRINELSGINIYDYLHNCPYCLIDEKGDFVWFPIFAVVIAAGLTSCSSVPNNNNTSYYLSYITVGNKSATQCGGFSWTIKWTLDPLPYNNQGIIAQTIEYSGEYYEKGNRNNNFDKLTGGNNIFTEYWQIQGTTISNGGTDTFSLGIHKCSKGKITIKAKATFYAGANLPNNVLPPDMNKPSGTLYYSPGGENLSGVQSNTVYREVHASWDCLDCMMHDTNVTGG